MKFLKIMAALLAVCMLGSALIACGGGETETETESATEAVKKITVTLKIEAPNGSKDDDIEQEVVCEATTLGDVIQYYCEVYNEDTADDTPFNSSNLLIRIGAWEGDWEAYFEGEGGGRNNTLSSIYSQPVKDGQTYVLFTK